MNKLFKGAVAGAAGVALLLGGAGTFALWQDTTNLGTEATLDAGHMRFGTVPEGQWFFNNDPTPLTDAEASALRLVPGDVLEYRVDEVPIIAHGHALQAELGVDWAGLTPTDHDGHGLTHEDASDHLHAALEAGAVIRVNGNTTNIVVGGDSMDPQLVDITVTITFDSETEELMAMGGRVDLEDFQLTLDQVPHPTLHA